MRWPAIAGRDTMFEHVWCQTLDPEFWVDNEPRQAAAGRDQQLDKAVEVLPKEVDAL